MEFITNKIKITVPNYQLDRINRVLTFYSKTNTKFQIQFNQFEMKDFVQTIIDTYPDYIPVDEEENNDLREEVSRLEEEVEDLKSDLSDEEDAVYELKQELKSIRKWYKQTKDTLETLLGTLPDVKSFGKDE